MFGIGVPAATLGRTVAPTTAATAATAATVSPGRSRGRDARCAPPVLGVVRIEVAVIGPPPWCGQGRLAGPTVLAGFALMIQNVISLA
jgi:hypothetical protein